MGGRGFGIERCWGLVGSSCSSFLVRNPNPAWFSRLTSNAGINLVTYYAPVIFEQSVGLSSNLSLLLAGFNGVAYFFSSLVPIWVLDRLGRRKLMLFACAGQACCMAVLAGTVWDGSTSAGIGATVMLFLFNFFFAVGLLAIPWLLPAEYAPLAIRTRAAALSSASNWIFTFLVVEITPVSIHNIGWKTYVYFAIFNAFFLPLIWYVSSLFVVELRKLTVVRLFYPETQNLTLEEIDQLFTGPKVLMHIMHAAEDVETAAKVEGPVLAEDKEMVVDRVDRV